MYVSTTVHKRRTQYTTEEFR